ncbi:MAG: hypothetical protein H7222_18050 [Methylotenera sp.]|nr:hypothetical protein [Oligoflexia bacterium]
MNRIAHLPLWLAMALALLAINASVHAAETVPAPQGAPAAEAAPENTAELGAQRPADASVPSANAKPGEKKGDRSSDGPKKKNIEFEDGVVEGLSKRGKDSLTQVGENDGRNRPRLYKKRLHFKEEMKEVYREMEYGK